MIEIATVVHPVILRSEDIRVPIEVFLCSTIFSPVFVYLEKAYELLWSFDNQASFHAKIFSSVCPVVLYLHTAPYDFSYSVSSLGHLYLSVSWGCFLYLVLGYSHSLCLTVPAVKLGTLDSFLGILCSDRGSNFAKHWSRYWFCVGVNN